MAFVYQPLDCAWASHEVYLRQFGGGRKRVVFVGMTQTGGPFGEIAAVRDWMGIREAVGKPEREHPKRPVLGFDCPQSEVSGRRLWGHFAQRFGKAEAFLKSTSSPTTAAGLHRGRRAQLHARQTARRRGRRAEQALRQSSVRRHHRFAARVGHRCRCLRRGVRELPKEMLRGEFKAGRVLHPSPAANRDWAGAATKQLVKLDVWE